MKTDPRDELSTFRRIQASHSRSSYSQNETPKAAPLEFGDRDIQRYMLNSKAPSADLNALYAAIRQQMTVDGCA